MTNKLLSLRQFTHIAADTGNIVEIKLYNPKDITTNPGLILQAAQIPEYQELMNNAILWAKKRSNNYQKQIKDGTDKLLINISSEILKLISGRISIEIDSRLSYDSEASIKKAKHLLELFNEIGINKNRILIKIASTWQGIRAAEQLEKEGINCNLTLLFSFAQARACAEAGVYLISPFVGRILDWYQFSSGNKKSLISEDPGVNFVKDIYQYYKKHNYKTIIMGASFRNIDEILDLSGCDYLTISPKLLKKLKEQEGKVERKLFYSGEREPFPPSMQESEFLWKHHQNPMAVDKLADGIRKFAEDQEKLEKLIASFL